MNDKIVTHEDLDAARALAEAADRHGTEASRELARSILAAAEADQPPLPEGWVVLSGDDGDQAVYWHDSGRLFIYRASAMDREGLDVAAFARDCLTPLRPTVTEADVEKAAQAARVQFHAGDGRTACIVDWDRVDGQVQEEWLAIARAAFEAIEIEVKN